jgi:hypothetical protein
MVESGMQQQAVGLICAALGVGMVFKSIRKSKISTPNPEQAVMRIKLDPMKPSYDGSFWSDAAPHGKKPWLKGDLPDPVRKGGKPLLGSLSQIQVENLNGRKATKEGIGQLLWASRGRTPHYYKSRPWGMTIPTNRGMQDITDLYLLLGRNLFLYKNWKKKRPTHSISKIDELETDIAEKLLGHGSHFKYAIVFSANQLTDSAYWEIGYELYNCLLQAYSLEMCYCTLLLSEEQQVILNRHGPKHPMAILKIF